jgi:hypothetical protein
MLDIVTYTSFRVRGLAVAPSPSSRSWAPDRGGAVTDLLKKSGVSHVGVTITAGNQERGTNVPKRNLVSALQVAFSTGRLKIASGLDLAPVLKEELRNFRMKINLATGHDSYEAWREGEHDDLVLAAALAVWAADRKGRVGVVHAR